MKKLEIEIPNNKEIDWAESAKQEKIVFKDKHITYEDACKKLFKNGYCYISTYGDIRADGHNENFINESTNASTQHQLECILAKNKLANVARYLNGEWKWELGSHTAFFIMDRSLTKTEINFGIDSYSCYPERSNVLFKSREAALQAIEILGEETVKLALEPLY